MTKLHTWHTLTFNYETIQYFYIREKNDKNGNPRYRAFIIDPDSLVYETILKCYEFEIENRIERFLERGCK